VLSKQSLAVLEKLRAVSFDRELVFPGDLKPAKPMSKQICESPIHWFAHRSDGAARAPAHAHAARRTGEGERVLRSGKWIGWAPTQLLGEDLRGKTLGLIGFGRIARETARVARGLLDVRIAYHPDRAPVRPTKRSMRRCITIRSPACWPNRTSSRFIVRAVALLVISSIRTHSPGCVPARFSSTPPAAL